MKFTDDVKIDREYGFSKEGWDNIPVDLWPVYSWIWATPISKEEIKAQLTRFYNNNIKLVYILPEPKSFRPKKGATALEPDYLTDEYFEMYNYAAEVAMELGMKLYFYDEGGWPSGSACGKVAAKKPHLRLNLIKKEEVASPYTPSKDAVAAFSKGKRIKEGETSDAPIIEYTTYPFDDEYMPPYPNISLSETTETFIEITHEAYKKNLKDGIMGNSMRVAFTDEPGVHGIGWTDDTAKEFMDRYGYDIIDYFNVLADGNPETEDEKQAVCDYFDYLSEKLNVNYFQKLRKWCRDNNMLSSGHLNGEHETLNCNTCGFHHVLRQMRTLDIPGIDTIWRQIFPGQKNHFFPRFASSAANQIGSPMTLSESFAIYGAGLTFNQMRYVMMHQMVRGINLINVMNTTYSYEGRARLAARPSFTKQLPTWEHLPTYNEYVARMEYLMTLGVPDTKYAIYMPMRDFWARGEEAEIAANHFDSLAYYLEEKHCQFDIIDDDFLETAKITDGALKTGTANYETVIVPSCNRMSENSKQVLADFEAKGGKVIYSNAPEDIEPTVDMTGEKTTVLKRKLDNGALYLIVNEADKKDTISINFKDEGRVYLLSAETGEIYAVNNTDAIELESGEGKVFFITNDEQPVTVYPETKGTEIPLTDFCAKRVMQFTIGPESFENKFFDEEYKPTKLEDWANEYGNAFSGHVSYRTSFKLNEIPEAIKLDLGDVRHSAEVFVNGKSVGNVIAKPYTIIITKDFLANDNELEMVVANTAANQYVNGGAFDDWDKESLGVYHHKAIVFESESLESGLLGPVKVTTLK